MAPTERKSPSLAARMAHVAGGVSRIGAFNALTPRDPATRPGADIAYGDQPMQALDVYAPVDAAGPAPVVLFFHGGGWRSGRRQEYAFAGRALAAQGFLTLVVGYRLMPAVRYPDFVDDAALAARWASLNAEAYGGDARRMALVGHSAGAYIALKLGLDRRHLQAVGVDPAQIRAIVGLSGPYHFLPLKSAATQAAFGHEADLDATQPVNYAQADSPPTLLIHGGRDQSVSAGQTVRMGRALTAAGAKVEVNILPSLNHADTVLALSRPFRGKGPILDSLAAFIRTHCA